MSGVRKDFGPEWALLEILCADADTPQRRQALADLVEGGLDWGELIDLSLRHKMLTLVAHELLAAGLAQAVPYRIADHLRSVVAGNLYRRRVWYGELVKVVGLLGAEGVAVAARKGAAYESSLYHGDGSRWLGDIDLMIAPADLGTVSALMPRLGYEVGLYDFDRDVITPFDRTELMKYRLNPDHLPTHSIATGDLIAPVIEIDFASSLTWTRSTYQVPTEDALRTLRHHEVRGVAGFAVPCLEPAFQFLDTVLHLFREAWIEWWLEMEQDVDLMKFGDVIRLYRIYRGELTAGGRFVTMISQYGVVEPVCWVLEHLDRTFGTSTIAELGLAGRVTEEFLFSAGGGGQTRRWEGTMRDRLYAKTRRQIFVDAG